MIEITKEHLIALVKKIIVSDDETNRANGVNVGGLTPGITCRRSLEICDNNHYTSLVDKSLSIKRVTFPPEKRTQYTYLGCNIGVTHQPSIFLITKRDSESIEELGKAKYKSIFGITREIDIILHLLKWNITYLLQCGDYQFELTYDEALELVTLMEKTQNDNRKEIEDKRIYTRLVKFGIIPDGKETDQ